MNQHQPVRFLGEPMLRWPATIHCRFTGSVSPSIGTDLQRGYAYVDDVVVSSD